ncbi:MAG: phosphate transporter [Melioribacteraceae bacterium]|nr:MAG: phosphate transporter [Melioribacteraceae bacterium]
MDIYFIIVVILFALAISDLIVGVSNDAVNFLNSAIGSKVAPRHIIMIIASLGILVGTTFSSGLMEVARKGIFHPDQFYYYEIMTVFLAVMLTDVLLLDLFNTFALPTSTTVSIVFELLGAAVAVSILKITENGEGLNALTNYINTSKALAIISGILLSVVISFTAGALIQWITRLIFSFDFEKKIKRYGAIWGGIALTAITFFILVKGAKGSSFLTKDTQKWIIENGQLIILYSFFFWAVVLQILMMLFKINILKIIVLVGTFALALAFAANDLVNFIGVPLAGLSSYTASLQADNPAELLMVALTEPVKSNTFILVLAGIVMVITLFISKKARSVTKTEVNLGRQSEGFERFESSVLARQVVRSSRGILEGIKKITPKSIQNGINNRFHAVAPKAGFDGEIPAFDMLRASVNLMMASILISFATSLKLPLSTTYVTFMVAMGTSLADRAWGRESAVYRVNGVLTVIGGWFFTALSAFTVAFTFAMIISFGGIIAILGLVAIAGFFIYRTHIIHKNRSADEEESERQSISEQKTGLGAIESLMGNSFLYINRVNENISKVFDNLAEEELTNLKDVKKEAKVLSQDAQRMVSELFRTIKRIDKTDAKKIKRFGKLIASIQGIAYNNRSIASRCYDHINNNHAAPVEIQINELKKIHSFLIRQTEVTAKMFNEKNFDEYENLDAITKEFDAYLEEIDLHQVERIKDSKSTPRNSILFIELLNDIEKISTHMEDLVKQTKKIYASINS